MSDILIKNCLIVPEKEVTSETDIRIPAGCPLSDRVFLLGRTGIYTHVETPFWQYTAESNKFSKPVGYLPKIEDEFYISVEIPKVVIYKALKFCQLVFAKQKTEAAIIPFIRVNEEGKFEWELYVPKQKNSHASVKYENDLEELKPLFDKGFVKFGTIHSHSDFGAGHSSTDINDEAHIDGIHITLGHVDQKPEKPAISISICAVGASTRFSYKRPVEIIEEGAFTSELVVADKELYDSIIITEEELAKASTFVYQPSTTTAGNWGKFTPSFYKGSNYGYYGWAEGWDSGVGYSGSPQERLPALTFDFMKKYLRLSKNERSKIKPTDFSSHFIASGLIVPRAALGIIEFEHFD
jgi:hypothetical protein